MVDKTASKMNIERTALEKNNISDFYDSCVHYNKPKIYENIFSLFPDLGKFNLDYLQRLFNNKKIKVNGNEIEFNEYCKLLEQSADGNKLYAWQQSIEYVHPELKPFFSATELIPSDEIVQSNLWLGPKGTKSALHFDLLNNFFFQLYGSKTFYLVCPNSLFKIYPSSPFGPSPNDSIIDLLNINEGNFPKIKEVNIFKVTLQAGSCLFLPSCWWHQVISHETSISINIWTKRPLFEFILEKFQMLPLGIKLWIKSLF